MIATTANSMPNTAPLAKLRAAAITAMIDGMLNALDWIWESV